MVIGNGLIASAFMADYKDDNKFVIFAAGVSNSFETNIKEFDREINLLTSTLSQNKDKHFVYFSSFIDSNIMKRKYLEHKLNIEKIIRESQNYYTILKLPQVIGRGGNSHELVNFIINKLKENQEITVYENTYKSLIDIDDVKRIIDILVKKWKNDNRYVEFPFIEKLLVHEIVDLIAKQLGIEPRMRFIESDINDFPEPSLAVGKILNHLNIIPKGYTEKIIKKYVKQ